MYIRRALVKAINASGSSGCKKRLAEIANVGDHIATLAACIVKMKVKCAREGRNSKPLLTSYGVM